MSCRGAWQDEDGKFHEMGGPSLEDQLTEKLQPMLLENIQYRALHGETPEHPPFPRLMAREMIRQMEWARHSNYDAESMTEEEWKAMKGPALTLAPEGWTP